MRELQDYLKKYPYTIANLGCGRSNPDISFGIDIQEMNGVDFVADLNESIPLPSDTFDEVRAQDFLEHIDQKKCINLMEEIYRILKPGGKLVFEVPSTDGNNMGGFSRPHSRFFLESKEVLVFPR